MVGTIEPRKGHAQVLEAFDALWKSGEELNLVIVGKLGWGAEKLMGSIRAHPQHNSRLFWLEGISDAEPKKLYEVSTCLIAASYGEGFGLPLIEAAYHGLPILARDIPVFHEVAGQSASYFADSDGEGLAISLREWLEHYQEGGIPESESIPWLTWEQSAQQLLSKLIPASKLQKEPPS